MQNLANYIQLLAINTMDAIYYRANYYLHITQVDAESTGGKAALSQTQLSFF